MRGIPWFLFGFVLVLFTFSLPQISSAQAQQNSDSIATSTIISLTNADRISSGLPSLHSNVTLEAAAQMKAEDMAAKGYFAHTAPDGKTPWYWVARAGYSFSYAGENLAVYFSKSEQIEKAWMNSPSHKKNIVSNNYSDIGVGIAYGTYNGIATAFVVEFFGSPSH